MSYRYMRVVIFFDLPTETSDDKREYRRFRKFLLRNGFIMMQESVYSKIALNTTVADAICENVKKHKTKDGLIQMLTITEKQFERIELVVGEKQKTIVDSDERLVIL